ncbi:MAG: division/cell wall cluster transcriptional repressor MraZ [Planctomycetota bacterium]|jgi:MraZ protein
MTTMTGPAFRGASTHSLDDKSRLIVPKRILDRLPRVETNFVLTASPDGCLLLLDQRSFEEVSGQIGGSLLDRNPENRGLNRLLLGHAEDVSPDRAGRILIPEVLRHYAGIGDAREVVVVGAGTWIELWAPDRWFRALDGASSSSLAEGRKVEPVGG